MAEATTQEATEYPEIEGYNPDGYVADSEETEFSSVDYESEAKKFQSMYDRAQSRNQELEKYQPLVDLLETRPDLVQTLQSAIVGGQPVQARDLRMTEDEFSPWKAFFDPGSESYKHVQKQVNEAVGRGVQQQMAVVKEQVFMNDLRKDLKDKYKFDDSMVEDFVQFYSTPKEDLPFETLVDVYLKTNGREERSKPSSSLDIVRANKQAPRSPGSVQGTGATPKTEEEKVWDNIKNAGGFGNRLP